MGRLRLRVVSRSQNRALFAIIVGFRGAAVAPLRTTLHLCRPAENSRRTALDPKPYKLAYALSVTIGETLDNAATAR